MIKRSYLLAHVMGIPIRVHITLVILLIWAAVEFGFSGILFTSGVFISVAIHELGHSWVAIRKGCRVHEIILLPIGGIAKMERIPTQPKDEFLVAAAGPATSLLLAGLFLLLAGGGPLREFFDYLKVINLTLCLFNLLPAFPMDGGRIFRAFMAPRIGRLKATELAARIGRIMAVAGGIFGLLNGRFLLILIAIFIYRAAGAEYRAVYMQQMSRDWLTAEQADIEVSPPPYARRASPLWKKWENKADAFFDNLFKHRK
ncbi:MAG: site-2 protease family protein [Pontiellaceae bacterium]|jgi:stage IV sporulation protein FB|nr:site-2 protease family protein [Pontiellaceae bacterium]